MRLNRYRKFVESVDTTKLREMIDRIYGHEMKVVDRGDRLEATFRVGHSFDLSTLQDLFEQVAEIEKSSPDITWECEGTDFVFEFHY